ncbi:MAG: GNAT family N-acetyltransferase [Planctomycetota bacterium]
MHRTPLPPQPDSLRVRRGHEADLPAIRSLLHRTFVDELGQYQRTGGSSHQDKFEHKNVHFLAEEEGQLLGLIAAHGEAPFSVAARIPAHTSFDSLADRPLEVRLLSVIPSRRRSRIAFQLMAAVFGYAREHGYHELWISGVDEQLPLYRKLGFEALGPAVPDGDVAFTPMRVRLDALPPTLVRRANRWMARSLTSERPNPENPLTLLPGPARIATATLRAAADAVSAPTYHRSRAFLQQYRRVQEHLQELMHGHDVAIFPGGGTHANDVLAQAIAHLPQAKKRRGWILSNGEFGRRLHAHAEGAGLEFDAIDYGWGQTWDLQDLERRLQEERPAWIWAVHCESSVGIRNPLEALAQLLEPYREDVALCLDAISTLGALPIPPGTAFVSTVSGKALQAHPGIAVLGSAPSWLTQLEKSAWPPSMDLPAHTMCVAPPHTLGSTVLAALDASLSGPCAPNREAERYASYSDLGTWVRSQLREVGAQVLAPEADACPVMTTFEVPTGLTTTEFLRLARHWGFVLAGRSSYHRNRRQAQMATFGAFQKAELEPLFELWGAWKARRARIRRNLHLEP